MTREEAINKVRQMSLPKETMDILEALAPELTMSEDEMMIYELQGFLSSFGSDYFGNGEWQKFDDWLEKQKEQKPKFYPGDVIKCTSTGSLWVRCKDGDNIRSDGHTACIGGGYELASKEEAVQFFQELNENGYQWDCIKGRPMKKEQKPEQYDIDILEKHITKDSISELAHTVIVRNGWEIVEKEQKPVEPNWIHHKVDLSGCSEEYIKAYYDGWNNCNQQHAQHDAKQKPAEWSEEDESMLEEVISNISEDYVTADYEEILSWLKALKYRVQPKQKWDEVDKRMLGKCVDAASGYYNPEDKPALKDWLKSLPERFVPQSKQEWSEDIIRKAVKDVGLTQHQIDWFKTNVFPPKQEWSEEDEKMRNALWNLLKIQYARDYSMTGVGIEAGKFRDWLKSLRPQPHTVSIKDATKFGNLEYKRGVKDGIQSEKSHQWKPSEEQMKALEKVRHSFHTKKLWAEINPVVYAYESLMRDLQKLL